MGKKYFINEKTSISCSSPDALTEALDFIENSLTAHGVNRKLMRRTEMLAEEIIYLIIKNASEGSNLKIQIKRFTGDTSINVSAHGAEFDPTMDYEGGVSAMADMEDEEAQQAIRSLLLKSQEDKLTFNHKGDSNYARILVGQASKTMLYFSVAALILGIILGALMRNVFPVSLASGISRYALYPIRTMFMNALEIIIAPVVFFSVVSCVSQLKELAELGKVAVKVMCFYAVTTIIAVSLGVTAGLVFKPGYFGYALPKTAGGEIIAGTAGQASILQTIIDIVPSNFITPLIESNSAQIIFIAALCGIAVGAIGKYTKLLYEFFEACNKLFLTVATYVTRFIPLAAFCSSAILVYTSERELLSSLAAYALTFLTSLLALMLVYSLLILIAAHLNPLRFFKNVSEGIISSFLLSSSTATMTNNIKICNQKLGISPKISNFAIPLGSTVNMDGDCLVLTVSGLFLARLYGLEMPPSVLVSFIFTIVLISFCSPEAPGAVSIALGVVLSQLGIPIEALGIVLGILPIINMFSTASNVAGDMVGSLIVAKSENLLDVNKFYGKNKKVRQK